MKRNDMCTDEGGEGGMHEYGNNDDPWRRGLREGLSGTERG